MYIYWCNIRKERSVSTDGNGKYYKGCMLAAKIPYIPLSRMRATHETLMQSVGVSDSLNSRLHGRSTIAVGYSNYLEPQEAELARAPSVMGELTKSSK